MTSHPVGVAHSRSAAEVPRKAGKRRISLPSLGLRFSERKLLLLFFDVISVNAALYLALTVRPDVEMTRGIIVHQFLWFITVSGIWITMGVILNVYDLARAANGLRSAWVASGAALLTGLIYLFIPFITPELPGRRLEALVFPLLASMGVAAWRIIYAQVFVQPVFQQRALVIGAGWSGQTLARALTNINERGGENSAGIGYQLLGFIDDDERKQGLSVEGIPVLGTRRDLVELVRQLKPDELIVAITNPQQIHMELFQAILDCREMGIPITTMATLYEELTGRVPVEHAGRNLHVVMPLNEPAVHRLYMLVRRIIDLLAGVFGCILTGLIAPIIWLANRFTSPGPLFYRQARVGRSGRTFMLIKFRSMVVDAEKEMGAVWASEADRRVTPVGRILRKTRLDELPQFCNVLKGEMTLIGPRPERPEFVAQLDQQIPFYRVRHAVKPGLTGWAQVKYRYGASVNDALIKLQYDLYYIKHQGPYLDLLILLKTIQVILGLKGR